MGWSNRFGRKRSGVVGAGVEIIGTVVSWQRPLMVGSFKQQVAC